MKSNKAYVNLMQGKRKTKLTVHRKIPKRFVVFNREAPSKLMLLMTSYDPEFENDGKGIRSSSNRSLTTSKLETLMFLEKIGFKAWTETVTP